MSVIQEFKAFLNRGSVLDLAVAVVIGAAFGKIVTSLVNDLLMPPIGMLLGGINFRDFFIALDGRTYASLEAAQQAGAPTLNYGQFANTVIEFAIVAFAVFVLVKQANRFKRDAPAAATTKPCPYCASDIPLAATRCPHCTSQLAAGS
jgi:large conductance mechanosensitive channel